MYAAPPGPDEPDELELAAARERTQREVIARRKRSWALSITGSITIVLVAITAVSLLHDASRPRPPRIAQPLTWNPHFLQTTADRERDQSLAQAELDTITLPAGWVRGPLSSIEPLIGPSWVATWTAPMDDPTLPAVLGPSFIDAGWVPCIAPGASYTGCWRRSTYYVLLASGCAAGVPCHELSVMVVQADSGVVIQFR